MAFSFKQPPKKTGEQFTDALCARAAARVLLQKRPTPKKTSANKRGKNPENHLFRKRKKSFFRRASMRFLAYFYKMRGQNPATYCFAVTDTLWSFAGAFIAMLVIAAVNVEVWGRDEQGLLIGSLGASAMLVFGAPHAPFAQPRNVIGGHIFSALVGVFVQQHLGEHPWLASALAVALAITVMHITATLHPPGGATALIAVVGSPELKQFGYEYALYPVGISVLVMVVVGVLYNNLSKRRRYPLYWW